MYEQYFGLSEKPFNITPDADFLYMSEGHRSALAMIEYGVFEQSGITVVTGEIGAGKTTLIRHLLHTASYDEITIALISNVQNSLGNLLQWAAIAMDLHTGEEELTNMQAFRRLQSRLIAEYSEGRKVVLVIDEAQNMTASSLEELRMLMNINADKNQLLQIVLVGQPELLGILRQPELAQVAQRVTAEYHLLPLNLIDTGAYIRSRLDNAGAEEDDVTFNLDAIRVIYYFSAGLPRLINTLCDHALVVAYGADVKVIDIDIALDTVKQKRIGGISRYAYRPDDEDSIRSCILQSHEVDVAKILEDCAVTTPVSKS